MTKKAKDEKDREEKEGDEFLLKNGHVDDSSDICSGTKRCGGVFSTLHKIAPGNSGSVSALRGPDGTIHTKSRSNAKILNLF